MDASNAVEGLEMQRKQNPDVLILDVGLPEGDLSGFDLFKDFHSFSNAPVIMVTARDRDVDIVRGLELGASDYLPKPFSAVELLARTRAVMRRTRVENLVSSQSFIGKDLSVDFDSRQVMVQGESVQLTPTEFKLLYYLVRNPHQALTTEEILEQVWGGEYRSSGGLLKAHI